MNRKAPNMPKGHILYTHTHTHTHVSFGKYDPEHSEGSSFCHPEPFMGEGSCVRFRMTESGRSLVEMLGMLAIMGILSVTGIAMYRSAMNRHYANELINEAQKRAATVAMQIASSHDTLSVAEFTNPDGYTFGVEKNPQNANQFYITITGMNLDVCQQLKSVIGNGSVVRSVSEFCDKIVFNNDLSQTFYPSDYPDEMTCKRAGYSWCMGTRSCWTKACCDGRELGPCESCSEGAIITTPMEGKSCTYDDNGTEIIGMCHLGKCRSVPENVLCNTDTGLCACVNGGVLCDRERGLCCLGHEEGAEVTMSQICNSGGDVDTDNTTNKAKCLTLGGDCSTNADCFGDTPWCQITEYTNCRTPSKGTCMPIEDVEKTIIQGLGEVLAGPKMNWWSAKNWCEAQGKRLFYIEDFQIYDEASGDLLKTGSGVSTAPCRQGKTCVQWNSGDANRMWDGASGVAARTLTDARDETGELYSAKYSPIVLDLAQHFRGAKGEAGSKNYIWTASDYSSVGSCGSFLVQVSVGYVRDSSHNNQNFVLCHQ